MGTLAQKWVKISKIKTNLLTQIIIDCPLSKLDKVSRNGRLIYGDSILYGSITI